MASKTVDQARETIAIPTDVVGPNAYAVGILGDQLVPDVMDGQFAVFDPNASRPLKGDIAAVRLHGRGEPLVVRLALAVPPADLGSEREGMLVVETTSKLLFRRLSMRSVRAAHRMVTVSPEAAHG